MKKQVLIINGGSTYDTHEEYISHLKTISIDIERLKPRNKWRETIQSELGSDYEIILPKMPNSDNAKYDEWKLWFEKIIPLLNNELILVGHSLGGIFLAKYLSENTLPQSYEVRLRKILVAILVAAPFDAEGLDESLGNFKLPDSLQKFSEQVREIYLFQSKDDAVVPLEQVNKYKEALPEAKEIILDGRGHFNDETFPEIVELIKSIR